MNDAGNAESAATSRGGRTSSAGGAWWRLPLLLAIVLVSIIIARAYRTSDDERKSPIAAPPAIASGKFVSLEIQFGDSRNRKFDAIDWQPGMTVDDLMTAATRLPDGITYAVSGEHEMMLLQSIDGVLSDAGTRRYWTYKVNDVPGDRSLAAYELQPGDRVLWTFGQQE